MIDAATLIYPDRPADRDRWIVAQRPARNPVDARVPYAFLVEDERAASGEVLPTATVFLTNRECPWRCVMCDLWRNTLTEIVPTGAIAEQIAHALARLPQARQIKLYNSGSFFDAQAIPPGDYEAIAALLTGFERVIVESHPALVGDRTLRFRDMLQGRLEVAMGLETVHPLALEKLNKRMTLEQFRSASDYLRDHRIDLRVFIIVQPPFVPPEEALHWTQRSIDFAFDCGATAVTVIPARGGNGAMETLAAAGEFTPPALATVEAALDYGIGVARGRVFVDLWDILQVSNCSTCCDLRSARLVRMNLTQSIETPQPCSACRDAA